METERIMLGVTSKRNRKRKRIRKQIKLMDIIAIIKSLKCCHGQEILEENKIKGPRKFSSNGSQETKIVEGDPIKDGGVKY